MPEVTFTFKGFNNVADPSNVGAPLKDTRALTFTEGIDLLNVDPSNASSASLRQGRGAPITVTTTAHSGWSNPHNPAEAYYVDGGALKRVVVAGNQLVTFSIRSGLPDLPMAFIQVNDVVRYGNGVEQGIIENGIDTAPFVPTLNFKTSMVPGNFLEFYNGRLYALQDNVLYCSDSLDVPGGIESMDTRHNVVAVFDGPGSMLRRTDTGLFVSAGGGTFFFRGDDPAGDRGGFEQISVAPYPAVRGTDQPIKAELLGIEGWRGWAALWYSAQGICAGSAEGVFQNLTQHSAALPAGIRGTSAIRQDGGLVHYVAAVQPLGSVFNQFRPLGVVDVDEHDVSQI